MISSILYWQLCEKAKFIKLYLLQNARAAREEVFAELANIVFFANAFFDKMIQRESGHDVEVVIKEGNDVTRMLKQIILAEIMLKNKANGKLMTKKEKVDFVLEWKKQSKKMLEDGGMVPRKEMNVFPSSTLVMHFRIAIVFGDVNRQSQTSATHLKNKTLKMRQQNSVMLMENFFCDAVHRPARLSLLLPSAFLQ